MQLHSLAMLQCLHLLTAEGAAEKEDMETAGDNKQRREQGQDKQDKQDKEDKAWSHGEMLASSTYPENLSSVSSLIGMSFYVYVTCSVQYFAEQVLRLTVPP